MEKEKEKQDGNVESNRRGFIGRFAKLAAAAGIGGAILAQLKEKGGIPPAYAPPGAPVLIDIIPAGGNFGVATTWLDSSTAAPGAPGTFVARNTAAGPLGEGLVGIAENLGLPPPAPFGVYGLANAGEGVRGDSVSGIGVEGWATAGSGVTKGVYGHSDSPDGTGVEGYATAGESTSGNAAGVYGHTDAPNTAGVRGIATASSSYTFLEKGGAGPYTAGVEGYAPGGIDGPVQGVYGHSDSMEGCGVWGVATATSGEGCGVAGYSESPDGAGVFGHHWATAGWAAGVAGRSDSANGNGVWGCADTDGGIGVLGRSRAAGAIPLVARAASGQTASLQEWVREYESPLAVVDKDGQFGIGTASPARMLHIRGNNAVARLDRDVDSASFIFVRTAAGDYSTVWKTFTFGVKATGVDTGSFFIGDMHTNVSGSSDNRLLIDTSGNVGIGTTTPSSKLHVAGRVKALGYDTGDITFANGVRATEEGKGLAFLNDAGEKIAVLDREGNFHIRGKFMEDL